MRALGRFESYGFVGVGDRASMPRNGHTPVDGTACAIRVRRPRQVGGATLTPQSQISSLSPALSFTRRRTSPVWWYGMSRDPQRPESSPREDGEEVNVATLDFSLYVSAICACKVSPLQYSSLSDARKEVSTLAVRRVLVYFKISAAVYSHMSPSIESGSRGRSDMDRQFPAYGPIEAVLGYVLFYTLIDRATPAIVTVFSDTVLDLSPSFVRFGLAITLWFVLVVTAIDQTRRQLAALGIGTYDDELRVWSRVTPSSLRTSGYLFAMIAGGIVAVITFDRAIATLLSLIPVVATVDIVAFDLAELFVMVVFFLSYSVAAHSFDRLAIGGIRTVTSE